MNMAIKKYLIPIFAVIIFLAAFAVRFYPVFHKGYVPSFNADYLILARNLSLTGEHKIENNLGVILNHSLVKEEGVLFTGGNKLTPILYSKLFDILGFDFRFPFYCSLLIHSIITVLLFLLVLRLFGVKLAIIFAGVDIFSPLIAANSIFFGYYEWAALFFTIGLFIYLYGEKPGYLRLIISGLFFGLSSLAGNVFVISFIPFLIYEFYKNRSFKRVFVFISLALILWVIYLGSGILSGKGAENSYLNPSNMPSSDYLHLFPDSYTYNFEKQEYIESISNTSYPDYLSALRAYDYRITFSQRARLYFSSITFYLKEFFRLTNVGGALTILFLFLGVGYLYKKRKNLLFLISAWVSVLYFVLILFTTSASHHFAELRFPVFLLVSLGIFSVIKFILNMERGKLFKYSLILMLSFFILLDLTQSDKWLFHEKYENSHMEEILDTIKNLKQADIGKENVLAVGFKDANNAPLIINYYTDMNAVYFDPNTVKRLLEENKLKWAFEQFGITGIVGYQSDLAEKIVQNVSVKRF
jgi:hypothetical protein